MATDELIFLPDVDTCDVESPDGYTVVSRWGACSSGTCGFTCCAASSCAQVTDPEIGQVRVPIPPQIFNKPGIYAFSVGIMTPDCPGSPSMPIAISKGVCMIEPSGFFLGNNAGNCYMPTIDDVRRKIDDFQAKNDLSKSVEYSDYDILYALIRAVFKWNETPPFAEWLVFNCSNYPFNDLWVEGAAAELFFASAVHYLRNKMQIQSGGLSADVKNRDREYLAMATQLRQEYLDKYSKAKYAVNNDVQYGIIASPYSYNSSQFYRW